MASLASEKKAYAPPLGWQTDAIKHMVLQVSESPKGDNCATFSQASENSFLKYATGKFLLFPILATIDKFSPLMAPCIAVLRHCLELDSNGELKNEKAFNSWFGLCYNRGFAAGRKTMWIRAVGMFGLVYEGDETPPLQE